METKLNNIEVKKIGDVLDYIAESVKKGEIVAASGQSVKMACVKVFSTVYGENWGNVRIEEVVLEDALSKYAQMEKGEKSSETIRTNKSKVRRVFRMLGLVEEVIEQENSGTKVEYEYYVISLKNNKAVKLAIPRGLSEEELAKAEKLVKDIFTVEGFKKRGGM